MELLETTANPLKLHRQAKKILKSTSRARNPDWYKRAHNLDLQWHLWIGAAQVVSGIYSKTLDQWFEGPNIPAVSFETDENGNHVGLDDDSRNLLHEILRQILGTKEFGGKPKSLGIIFHLADSVRVRDLAPDFSVDPDFDALDELLTTEPGIALGDDSVHPNEGFWHIFPLLGASEESEKKSIAIQVSSQYKFLIDELREYGEFRNIPVIAEVISAALESMAALPLLIPEAGKFQNCISLIHFEAFTLLCATGAKGELLMLRPVPHRDGNALNPSDYSELISNSAALLNLKAPVVNFVSMPGLSPEQLDNLLSLYKEQNPDAVIHGRSASEHPATEKVPGKRFEFAFLTAEFEIPENHDSLLLEAKEKWAIQDFCGLSKAEVSRMPTRGDLRLLKFSLLSQKIAIVILLGFAGWTGMDFVAKMRSEAWKLDPQASTTMQERMAKLQKEKNEFEHWDNLLAKRSEGWIALETILSIFPDDGGVILSNASYTTRSGDEDDSLTGFHRQWTVSGYANPKVATSLPSLGSRPHVANLLNKIAEESGADYLRVEGESRNLEVKFQQKQGTMPPSVNFPPKVARHFRTAFEFGIEQIHSPDDDLALNIEPLD